MSGDRFLESSFLVACPGLREPWNTIRQSHGGATDDHELLTAVRLHVVELLVGGRIAEFTRFTRTVERLLGEADPVLYELLVDGLLRPLARDVAELGVADARVAPHLGPRMRLAWSAGAGGTG